MCMPQAETPQPTSVKQYLKLQFNLQLDAQPLKSHKTIMLVNPLLRKALCPTSLFLFVWKETSRQAIRICENSKLKLLDLLQFIMSKFAIHARERKKERETKVGGAIQFSKSSTLVIPPKREKPLKDRWHYTTVPDYCTTSTQMSYGKQFFLKWGRAYLTF